jgi:type I restriction enzyme S subunit
VIINSIIPSNWQYTDLENIADINPKFDKSKYSDELEVSFIPMKRVSELTGIVDLSETRKFGEVKKGYTPFQNGDIIFAKITPCMENGKVAILSGLLNDIGFGSTEFHVLRLSNYMTRKYLFYYLVQEIFRRDAERNMTGSVGQKRVPTDFLKKTSIPLPPLQEQHRIVNKIEELFTKLDAGVEALKKVQVQLKRYRQSVLKAACNGLVGSVQDTTYFQKDNWKTIDLAIDNLNQGWSPKCERNPSASPDIWGVIKTTAVQSMSFVDSENKKLPDHLSPRPTLEIQTEDILVTRAGPRKRVGIACLVKAVRSHLMVCDKVYRIRCKDNKILPRYMELILNAPQVMDAINNLKTGISDSGVNLTQKRFLDLKIPLPPLGKQKKISDEVEHLLSIIEASEQIIESELKRAQSLRQSILKRALEGKLVLQDPNDEPVSFLLERIKVEKDISKKSKQLEMF